MNELKFEPAIKIVNLDVCPVCKNKSRDKLPKFSDDYLVRCKKCQLVFSERKPTQAELDAVYNQYSYVNSTSTSATIAKKEKIVDVIMKVGVVRSVLDVGCGNGEWLDAFRRRGCVTYGTEYNEHQRQVALAKGHEMLNGGLFPLIEEGQQFDLIVFTEVIEHIQNPIDVLFNFNKLLAEGGIVFITTPNFSAIERYVLGNSWGMICYPEHLTYFTPGTLHFTLQIAKFSKIALYTENISLYRILQAIGASRKSQIVFSDNLQSLTASGGTLSLLKFGLNKLLAFFGVGVSIVAIYKKAEKDTKNSSEKTLPPKK